MMAIIYSGNATNDRLVIISDNNYKKYIINKNLNYSFLKIETKVVDLIRATRDYEKDWVHFWDARRGHPIYSIIIRLKD